MLFENYKNLETTWDDSCIKDCCNNNNPDDPECGDCCYTDWQQQLKEVEKSYLMVIENAAQLQKQLDFVLERRNQYKKWSDELDIMERQTRDVCNQFKLIASQTNKIWFSSCKAVDAITILFCMIRDFFIQLDKIRSYADYIDNCVKKNTDEALNKGQGILKYYDEYCKKLEAVLKTREEIIKNILEAIRLSNLIRNGISTKDCHAKGTNICLPGNNDLVFDCNDTTNECGDPADTNYYSGFKTIMCEWINELNCNEGCSTTPSPEQTQVLEKKKSPVIQNAEVVSVEENCCGDNCDLDPYFTFPICKDEYKICVDKRKGADDELVDSLTKDLNKINKEKESLSACKDSLKKAIEAVKTNGRC